MLDYAYRGKTDLPDECLEITNYVQATRCVLHQHTQSHRQTKLRLKAFNNFFLSAKIWYWLKQMKIFKIGDAESPRHFHLIFFILRTRASSMQQQRDLPIQRNNEDLHTNFRWSRRLLYSGNAWTRYFVKIFRIYLIKITSLWRVPYNQNTTADKKLLRALNLNFVCRCGCVCRCSTHRVART